MSARELWSAMCLPLPPDQKLVMIFLAEFCDQDHYCEINLAELGRYTGFSEDELAGILQRMAQSKRIVRDPIDRNIFKINLEGAYVEQSN